MYKYIYIHIPTLPPTSQLGQAVCTSLPEVRIEMRLKPFIEDQVSVISHGQLAASSNVTSGDQPISIVAGQGLSPRNFVTKHR